jgi:hypothetical protein
MQPLIRERTPEHFYNFVSWQLKDDVSFDTLDLLRDPTAAAKQLELLCAPPLALSRSRG